MRRDIKTVNYLYALFIIGLTILFGIALLYGLKKELQTSKDYALVKAEASYKQDLLYRRWGAMHGGVYVPITDETPPNPYLSHIPDRDIISEKGLKLTLVNPAYMTRQVYELADEEYGTKGHITSLNPIRKENKPDEWETEALKAFESGEKEVSSIEKIDGVRHMRYMQAMIVEKSCLKCHSKQGYKEGDIRGGISVSVPMDKYDELASFHMKNETGTYALVYIMVLVLTLLGFKRLKKEILTGNLLQTKINENEKRYHSIITLSDTGAWEYKKKEKVLWCSPEYFEMLGRSPEDYPNDGTSNLEENWINLIHPDDRALATDLFAKYLDGGSVGLYENYFRMQHANGSWVWIWSRGQTIRNNDGSVSNKTVGTHINITERKKAEQQLMLYIRALEASSVSVVITDADGVVEYVNPFFTKNTGYTLDEVRGENPRILKSGTQNESFYEDLWNTLKSGKDWSGEFQNKKKNGELFWESAVISPIKSAATGQITHFVAIKEDITELLEKEGQLKQSLKEKEVLLAEIHHRVKNNLAVVSGMMQLQSFDEENPDVQEKLSDSISRIKTIAKIHEKLYQNETFSSIDLSENIRELTHENVNSLSAGKAIEVEVSLERVQLNMNEAVPCSLIVNEVLVNALKHAFINKETGNISVHLSEQENQVEVTITDNGIGFPEDFTPSTGTRVIQVLTEQLEGEHRYERIKTGTEFTLTFEKTAIKGS